MEFCLYISACLKLIHQIRTIYRIPGFVKRLRKMVRHGVVGNILILSSSIGGFGPWNIIALKATSNESDVGPNEKYSELQTGVVD